MNSVYILLFVSAVFNGLTAIIAGLIVYFKDKNHIINRTFSVLCIFVTIWSFGYFFPLVQYSKTLSLLSFRILMTGALFSGVALFHFVCAVLKINKEYKKHLILGYVLNIIILFFYQQNGLLLIWLKFLFLSIGLNLDLYMIFGY